MKPKLGDLNKQQQGQCQEAVAHFQPRPLTPHDQKHDAAGCKCFGEATEPDQRLCFSTNLAEVVEHIECLWADGLTLSGDQITLANFNGGNSLFGELFFDQLFAQKRIGAEVAAPLKTADQQLRGQCSGGFRGNLIRLELDRCGSLQLIDSQAADQTLAEHALGGASYLVVPGEMLNFVALFQPDLFCRVEVHRADTGS